MIVDLIDKLVQKEDLTFDESKSAMTLIMEGEATPSQFGSSNKSSISSVIPSNPGNSLFMSIISS